MIKINFEKFIIANNLPITLIAGPCVIESEKHCLMMVEKISPIPLRGEEEGNYDCGI